MRFYLIVLLACLYCTQASTVFAQQSDMLHESGLLKQVEDSGYPFVSLHIEFPERGFSEYFSLNLEEVRSVDINILNAAIGRYVSIDYTSNLLNVVLDLQQNGRSLIGVEELDLAPDVALKTLFGVLENAAEVTAGDIPGEFTIQGEKFPFFITPEIAAANGATVTVYYIQRASHAIQSLEVR